MAPVKSILIRLVSSAGTGYFYATRKCVQLRGLLARAPTWAPLVPACSCARAPRFVNRVTLPPIFSPNRNPTNIPYKLAFMKYDPVVRQHVLFTEAKMPKGRGGRRAGKK